MVVIRGGEQLYWNGKLLV